MKTQLATISVVEFHNYVKQKTGVNNWWSGDFCCFYSEKEMQIEIIQAF